MKYDKWNFMDVLAKQNMKNRRLKAWVLDDKVVKNIGIFLIPLLSFFLKDVKKGLNGRDQRKTTKCEKQENMENNNQAMDVNNVEVSSKETIVKWRKQLYVWSVDR